jgi:hypothetical protein
MVKRELDQSVFEDQPRGVVVAAVDYDGMLKFGDNHRIRYTWASERWRGCNWISKVEGTRYEPLSMLIRES